MVMQHPEPDMPGTLDPAVALTPEEESVDEADDLVEGVDDTLPADLWFSWDML